MSTVAVLGVFSCFFFTWLGLQLNAMHQYKFKTCALLKSSFAAILPNSFKIGRKIKKGARFFETVYIISK